MTQQTKIHLFYYFFILILLGFIWGSGYTLARYATTHGVSPLGYAFWQSVGPALVTFIFSLPRLTLRQLKPKCLRFYAVCGIIGLAIPNTNLYFMAPHLSAGLLAVVINTVPLLIYPLALIVKDERWNFIRGAGVLVGIVGLMLLALPSVSLPKWHGFPYLVIALLSPLGFALCAVYSAKFRPREVNSLVAAVGMLIVAALLLTPLAISTHDFYYFHWPLTTADKSVLLEIILSSLGYVLFFELLKNAGAVFYSLVDGIVALTGLFWGWLIFKETISMNEAFAIFFILLGVTLVSLKQTARLIVSNQT